MQRRKLGDLTVSEIAFGCMSLGIADIYSSAIRSDQEEIVLIAPKGAAAGLRHAPAMMDMVNRQRRTAAKKSLSALSARHATVRRSGEGRPAHPVTTAMRQEISL